MKRVVIKQVLGYELAYKSIVSSTKSMTGHLLGGAGAVETVASIMAINTGIVPPTVGYNVKDPACGLDVCPNVARHTEIDLALNNSIGFGGHNSCLAFKGVE